ncbi:MAG: hypothetical protein GYA61_04780 [Spirochaetales bacterium]|jgi:predicted esterase YcpF (UPF0227 family)|nr:hypothetical protein [Exilispira sp.]NMC67526.1 hypothetical protein [Spirochaetales bacterium]
MKLLFISDSDKEVLKNNINLENFKFINSNEYFQKENYYSDKESILIIDRNSIKEEKIERIRKSKNPESIILLSETLDWDKLIDTFQRGETFYVKPVRKEDFENFK